mmetsp:Transcript_38901/g.107139  ORF Transcript_38901/g.107139 Transcript_38901/m.107139 type:complete len:258 (-) Transcript_38901:374-1147(-)
MRLLASMDRCRRWRPSTSRSLARTKVGWHAVGAPRRSARKAWKLHRAPTLPSHRQWPLHERRSGARASASFGPRWRSVARRLSALAKLRRPRMFSCGSAMRCVMICSALQARSWPPSKTWGAVSPAATAAATIAVAPLTWSLLGRFAARSRPCAPSAVASTSSNAAGWRPRSLPSGGSTKVVSNQRRRAAAQANHRCWPGRSPELGRGRCSPAAQSASCPGHASTPLCRQSCVLLGLSFLSWSTYVPLERMTSRGCS